MTTCSTNACGVGGWGGPLPGDPDNNSILSATPAFGGIDVSWTYPGTNPEAVAHVILYRGVLPSFNAAIVIATVGGNFFYDKSTSPQLIQYYYWITIVSVNGTVGAPIGPASAMAKPPIASVIEGLTAQIDAGFLAQSLKTEIDKITLNYADLLSEVDSRIAANTALSAALAQVQSGVNQTLAFINEEITQRQEGDSSLVSQVNTIAAANSSNLALIQQEQVARVNGDSANAGLYTTLNAQVNNATTGLPATRATLINDYYTKAGTDGAISTATSALVSTTALNTALGAYTNTAALQTNYYTKTQTNSAISTATSTLVSTTTLNNSLGSYTTTAALQTNYYTKTQTDSAISNAFTTVQVSAPNGGTASVQTAMTAQYNLNNGFKALYTAKVSVNGLIGGFGIYNDGTTVEAGFDVDTFWVGKTQANKRKPFIISGGVTYIDEAAIEKLTFTKLRDASGSVVIENGKIKADYLNVTTITGGAYTAYAWPAAGQKGFFLGPSGLLLGNFNGGGPYLQYDVATGTLQIGGSASFSGTLTANTVNTTNIVGSAITSGYSSSTTGTSTSITITVPSGASSVIVIAYLGDQYTYSGGSGENTFSGVANPQGTLVFNGSTVTTQNGTLIYSVGAPTAGTFAVTITRNTASGTMNMSVLVSKR